MAEIMYCSTYGSDDPTRATFPFVAALGAIEAGHEARLVLMGEAVTLMKEPVVNAVHGVGWPPLSDLWTKVVGKGIPVHV
jgi:predicted peroxiredoxin